MSEKVIIIPPLVPSILISESDGMLSDSSIIVDQSFFSPCSVTSLSNCGPILINSCLVTLASFFFIAFVLRRDGVPAK